MSNLNPNDKPQNDIPTTSQNVVPHPLKLFLRQLSVAGKSKATVERYHAALSLFMGYFDNRDPAEITPDQLSEFFEDIRVRRKAATANLFKSAVRQFYGYLIDTEKITKDPSRLVKNEKTPRKSPDTFTESQFQALLDKIADEIGAPPKWGPMRDWMLYSLMFNAGLRLGEAVATDIKDVEHKTALEVIGKGDKLRKIPLNQNVQLALRKYLPWRKALRAEDPKALFLNRFGRRITKRAVEMNLKAWLKKAQIDADLVPHSLRHTFGTLVQRKYKNLRVTQELLGHAHPNTTQIYTHVDDGEARKAVESLE